MSSCIFGWNLTRRQTVTRWLLLLASSFLCFVGCSSQDANEPKAVRPLKVATARLGESKTPQFSREYSGIVQARRASALAAKEIGRVDAVFVDIGDAVAEGGKLIQLDTEQLNAEIDVAKSSLAAAESRLRELEKGPRDLEIDQAISAREEAQANLSLAQENYKRLQEIESQKAVSQQELDEAKYRVDSLASALSAAEQQLALLNEGTRSEQLDAQKSIVGSLAAQLQRLLVRQAERQVLAPYAGIVQSRLIDEGDVVAPGQVLLNIVENEYLEIHVGLPEELSSDANYLREHTRIVSGEESIEIRTELERMSPVVDPITRTRKCIFRVESPGTGVPIGGVVRVIVSDKEAEMTEEFVPWVPSDALYAAPRGLWALLVLEPVSEETYQLQTRHVELLRVRGEWSQIRGTVTKGLRFVAAGTHRVVPGQLVELKHE